MPKVSPKPWCRKNDPAFGAADDDAKQPCAASIEGAAENGAESSDSPKDHDGDGEADAVGQENGTNVAASHRKTSTTESVRAMPSPPNIASMTRWR